MEHIDPELLKRMDALAAKMGVTAQYLWAVLIRQAYVEGLTGLALACGMAALVVAGAFGLREIFRERTKTVQIPARYGESAREETTTFRYWEDFGDGTAGLTIMGCVVMVAFSLWAITLFNDSTLALLNPAFFAYKHIGDVLR